MMHLFAATVALSSGSIGCAAVGVLTLANAYFGRVVRRRLRANASARSTTVQQKIGAPQEAGTTDDKHAV